MVLTEQEPSKMSSMKAFVLFMYSGWIFLFSITFNTMHHFLRLLMNLNTLCNELFKQWMNQQERSGRGQTQAAKATSDTAAQKSTQDAAQKSNPAKRSASWKLDSPSGKKANTTLVTAAKPLYIRNVYVVFRVFRYNEELMGFAVWNSFVWRETIDQFHGVPANAYLRIDDILLPTHDPPLVEEAEGNMYTLSNDASEIDKHSLAHLLLFSQAERSQFRMTSQLPGFHFVTKRGLNQVPIEKWLNADDGDYGTLTEELLTHELNTSKDGCQHFLAGVIAATQNATTPGMFMNNPARYTLIRQSRNIPQGCMHLFDRLLNTARGNVSRHVPPHNIIIPAPVEVADGDV